MYVHATQPWSSEHVFRKDSAVRDHHGDVHILLAEPFREFTGSEFRWLVNVDAEVSGSLFYRRRGEREASTRRLVRLTNHSDDLRNVRERVEAWNGERGSSKKNGSKTHSMHDSHRSGESAPMAHRYSFRVISLSHWS